MYIFQIQHRKIYMTQFTSNLNREKGRTSVWKWCRSCIICKQALCRWGPNDRCLTWESSLIIDVARSISSDEFSWTKSLATWRSTTNVYVRNNEMSGHVNRMMRGRGMEGYLSWDHMVSGITENDQWSWNLLSESRQTRSSIIWETRY